MNKQLGDIIALSNEARLIPVVADSKKEERATSVLLSAFTVVPTFAHNILSEAGGSIGKRSKITCYTEVTFPKGSEESKARPDGLIVVTLGKKVWTALVESKIGNAELTTEQVETYLDIAKNNGIDAVITISNQFASDPTHHPVKVSKIKTRTVGLFHFSWTAIESSAYLLSETKSIEDPEQAYILKEVIRYYSHESSGINAFNKLHSDWKDVCDTVQNQGSLNKNSDQVKNSAASWIQLWRYMSLMLGKELKATVTLALSRQWKSNYSDYLNAMCTMLANERQLETSVIVPNSAANIIVTADFNSRTISFCMTLQAPKDRARSSATINWLTRQLKNSQALDKVTIRAHWGRSGITTAPLLSVLENPDCLMPNNSKSLPTRFDAVTILDLGARFKATKALIEEIETHTPNYYRDVGQHLTKWLPKPPKIEDSKDDPTSDTSAK